MTKTTALGLLMLAMTVPHSQMPEGTETLIFPIPAGGSASSKRRE